ncbi:MAG: hypothetical protein AAB436_00015 [Patescibacteria group bacterium]
MIKRPDIGVEFELFGEEILKGQMAGATDCYYAGLVVLVVEAAVEEGFALDIPKADADFGDKPLLSRMKELRTSDRKVAMLYDHEVPAVLGMCRAVVGIMRDPEVDCLANRTFSQLPRGSIQALANSLEEYEELREVA